MPRTLLDKHNRKYDKLRVLLNGTAKARGMKQEEIADALGCSTRTVANRLKNPGDITLDELIKLGRLFDIPLDEIRQSIQY